MHAAQILSVAIRATAAADSVVISDSLRGVQLSTSGQKSMGAVQVKGALTEHAERLGNAVAQAVGLVKEADRLAHDLIVHAPHCAAAFTNAFHDIVITKLSSEAQGEPLVRTCLRIKALLQTLEVIGGTCAPGTREGEIFSAIWDHLLETDRFLVFTLHDVFVTNRLEFTTSLKKSIVSAFSAALIKSKKWNERWRSPPCSRVAKIVAKTSRHSGFVAVLKGQGARRADQLVHVQMLEACAGAAFKILLGPCVPEVDGEPPSDFGEIRSLLPSDGSFQTVLLACEESPECDVLHAAAGSLFNAVASLAYSAGLSPSVSMSEPAHAVDRSEATYAAVCASVFVDDCRMHAFVVRHQHDQLRTLACLLATISHSLVVTFGDDEDTDRTAFTSFCENLSSDAIRCAINPESERMLTKGEILRRYCVAATERQIDIESTAAPGSSLNSPSGARVRVDEVDDLPVRSPGSAPISPSVPYGGASATHSSQQPAPAAILPDDPPIRIISAPPHQCLPDPVQQESTSTLGTGTGNFSPPSGGESLSFDRQTDGALGSDLSTQSSLQSQGSKKFGIVRRRTTASPGAQAAASPSHVHTAATLAPPEFDADDGAQLSLTSSLNESCHSGLDRGSSYETDGGGKPLQPPRRLRRAQPSDAGSPLPPVPDQAGDLNSSQAEQPGQPDLFAAWGK
jgi:hypothetical protein